MHVLQSFGPQETTADFDHPYDHPYFGQLFLASILNVIGYPYTVESDGKQSAEEFYLAPRLLVGVLAIIDTFLVYKIAERKYNTTIALIASVLFAVMPITILLRGIFLDNILLPLLLLSILFALYASKSFKGRIYANDCHTHRLLNEKSLLVLLSGIFLGLAIFTKSPAFTATPLVGFIIYASNNRNFRLLLLWLVPVITMALVWPAYNLLSGQFDQWVEGIVWQAAQRSEKPLPSAVVVFAQMDPVFIFLAIAGLIYATIMETRSRSLFIILWIIPYLIFLYIVGWVSYFHWIIILPGFSIAAAIMLNGLTRKISGSHKLKHQLYNTVVISAIVIVGVTFTAILITFNVTASYFDLYSSVVGYLADDPGEAKTLVGHRWTWAFTWIPSYVFDETVYFENFNGTDQIKTEKFMLLVDNYVKRYLADGGDSFEPARVLYNNSHTINTIQDETVSQNEELYPYTFMSQTRGIGRYSPVEIRANY
jgi:hypothetical protein